MRKLGDPWQTEQSAVTEDLANSQPPSEKFEMTS